jgi:AcrR family transcriptional regulator
VLRLREIKPDHEVGRTVGVGHFHELEAPAQVNATIERFPDLSVRRRAGPPAGRKTERLFRFCYGRRVATTAAARGDRADARRNRARLVAAARDLFASEGVEVGVRDLAGHAGVGVGTLYRHFPTRDELVDAVLEDAFEELVAAAETALEEPDAWLGFRSFVEAAVSLHSRNRGLKDVVETHVHGRRRADSMRRRLRPLVDRLVARARDAGALRADFTPQDLPLLFWGADRVLELGGDVSPELWRRLLGFLFDGLRAEAATPLGQAALTPAELRRIGRDRQ